MTREDCRRRRFLRHLGSVAGLAGLAGCPRDGDRTPDEQSPPPVDTETPRSTGVGASPNTPADTTADRSASPDGTDQSTETPVADRVGTDVERVVDVVTAGANPAAEEPIGPILDDAAGDRTVLYFPPGEYLLADTWRYEGFRDLALVGDGATIRPVEGFETVMFGLGGDRGTSGLAVHGLTFDLSAEHTGARPLLGMVEDGLEVVDVRVVGRIDVDQDCFRFDVTDPDGSGIVRGLEATDGGVTDYPITGCYVGESSRGELRIVDCHIAGFPDNGLYASAAPGPVSVEGGSYRNNDVANVRVSGPATVSGVEVVCDSARDGFRNARGIRLREGEDVLVDDCRITVTDVTGSDGAIALSNWLQSATIRNTRIVVGADGVSGIWAKTPDDATEDGRIRIRDVEVSGGAARGAAIRFDGREGCLVERVCIDQSGQDRDGLVCARVSDSTVRDSTIAVTGEPIVLDGASIVREDVRTPDPDGDACD